MKKRFLALFLCMILITQVFGVNIAYADDTKNTTNANEIDFKEIFKRNYE